jgi:hypothetical protein
VTDAQIDAIAEKHTFERGMESVVDVRGVVRECLAAAAAAPADDSMAAVFEEQRRNDHARAWAQVKASIRNAIVDIEEGDTDEAIATLKALIGDER